MLGDVAALLGRAVRVDAGRARPGRHRREVRDEPLGAVEGEDDDALARLDAERHEGARGLTHRVTVPAPRGRLPGAPALPRHRRPLRVGTRGRVEDLEDGRRPWSPLEQDGRTLGARRGCQGRAPRIQPSSRAAARAPGRRPPQVEGGARSAREAHSHARARRRRPSGGRAAAGRSSGRSRSRRGSARRRRARPSARRARGRPPGRLVEQPVQLDEADERLAGDGPGAAEPCRRLRPRHRALGDAHRVARPARRRRHAVARGEPAHAAVEDRRPGPGVERGGEHVGGAERRPPAVPLHEPRSASRHGRPARPAARHRSRGQDHWWSMPKRTRRPARVASTRTSRSRSRRSSRVNGPSTLRGGRRGRPSTARSPVAARRGRGRPAVVREEERVELARRAASPPRGYTRASAEEDLR